MIDLTWVEGALAEPDPTTSDAVQLLLERREQIERTWTELCAWDPELPPDSTPPVPAYLLTAIAAALTRPQPLGWGLDPALVHAAGDLAARAATPEQAVAQLVCLGHAIDRSLIDDVRVEHRIEVLRRLHMIIARLTSHTVRESTHRLRTLAFTDTLTGLPNRRAFDDDLSREVSRARRHHHPLSLAVLDIDGLKTLNDSTGHEAGDAMLQRVANVLRATLRHEDVAYRIGGDEFAIVLPSVDIHQVDFLRDRLTAEIPVSIGVASSARDPIDDLFAVADRRLYDSRRVR